MEAPAKIKARIERLTDRHQKDAFDCGNKHLNRFLLAEAGSQDFLGKLATYVALDAEDPQSNRVLGFYSIGITALRNSDTHIRGQEHEWTGFVHLAYLATRLDVQRRGIGDQLLFHALSHVPPIADRIGVLGVYLLAAGARAHDWYQERGFAELPCGRSHMFIPTQEIRRIIPPA